MSANQPFPRCSYVSLAALALVAIPTPGAAAEPAIRGPLQVQPARLELRHPRQPHSLLVAAPGADGQTRDLTGEATFTSADPAVATVDVLGWVQPVASGRTTITIRSAGQTASVPVTVTLPAEPPLPSFRDEVVPVLTKAGCNSGACHGYSLGKGGFKLSLRGGDDAADFRAITEELLGRRVNRHHADASLLLRKPLGEVPHKGGIRLEPGDALTEAVRGWIAAGAPADPDHPPELVGLTVHPQSIVARPGASQQLQAVARYADGSTRDVTRLAVFSSNAESIALVDEAGLVRVEQRGETALVVRFGPLFDVARVVGAEPVPSFTPTPPPADNLVDRHVLAKLNELKVPPADRCDDADFLRRVHLDLIGLPPTPAEVRAFLANGDPDKRARVIEQLFERPEFVDHWSVKWGDLLQNSRAHLSEPAMKAFHEWIRQAVAENRPLDEFARQVLTSVGDAKSGPAAAFFVVSANTEQTVERVTQVFCGVRMLCAKCHHHPWENWTQADFYGVASFFSQVVTKQDPAYEKDRKAKIVEVNAKAPFAVNPRTGARQPPRFLGGDEAKLPDGADRREAYARWLTSPENPYFARSLANRLWSSFFHRGLIDPVDDLRSTNPPTNPALLDALTRELVDHRFDARHLMRLIVASRTYQRSSRPTVANAHDTLNYSWYVPRRLPAEALVDSLAQATGVPEAYPGYPAGTRAAQLPDPVFAPAGRAAPGAAPLLALFGKPQRMEACECERSDEMNMLQALEFINGKAVLDRVAPPGGRVDQLLKQKLSDEQLIDELYFWVLARPASAREIAVGLQHFQGYDDKRAEAAQDLMWALLNSKDFLFNR